ncbi:MAG: hypothetical protein K2L11_11695 [Muribaculaceae bacterium]|nr:hypothetical protein [Muribaculaceae bacterium]
MRSPFSCDISGIKHHCRASDHGNFKGYIMPENNPFDSNAIAIYNEFDKLVGYIPRELTAYVRMWANNKNIAKLPCNISLEIIPSANVYRGGVAIYDTHQKTESPFTGKKVYICSDFVKLYKSDVVAIAKSFGAIINSSLKKDTDYVIYDQSLPDIVKTRKESSNFSFKEIHICDFIAEALPEDERDERFFGKEVAFASNRETMDAELAARYLIEHGARLTQRYKKRTTDVLIKWDKWTNTATVSKAIEDGKTIVSVSELLGYEDLDSSIDIKSNSRQYRTTNERPIIRSHEPEIRISSNQAQNSSNGCASVIAVIFISIVAISFLLC